MDVTTPLPARASGVTLIELLSTSAVALTLTAIAVPALSQFNTVQETAATANALLGALALARSVAVTNQSIVVVCPSTNGTACTGGFDWSEGWMVFTDQDGDRARDTDEQRHSVSYKPAKQVQIITSTGRRKIVYRPDGSATGTNATFRICNARDPNRRRSIIVSNTGRSRISNRDADEENISCE